MKLAAVLLNYNDYEGTRAQLDRIRDFSLLSRIVIVDNHSTDGSGERLRELAGGKICFLSSWRNGGYGSGNDLGIRYAAKNLAATHILVANPDAVFSEDCLGDMARLFIQKEKAGAASAVMWDRQGRAQKTAWPLRGFLPELLNSGPVCRRLFSRFIDYPPSFFRGRGAVRVGVLHGSLLLLSAEAYLRSGGYDPKVFLYAEENILARRLSERGYESYLLRGQSYYHENSGTISRSIRTPTERQKLRQESERYYYRQYLGIKLPGQLLTLLFQWIVLLETRLLERLGLLR
ncbi:glycosyltransferase, group 2 family protein [Oribacterium sp. oral taxon 078 str. F0263]|uniref:glycosyltransferase family 2 protein n=1 Tax=Oribacterium sp. oral taxon 078 TaxID=652706 RepID=UPI0003AE10ED|nr:glycosyltransferase family 2 protein [Oribacterium sp. oral taxon 078]ERL20644.1 glycosyltransferase, group 2 family protein [Oribacterium sp. oral taxon 078 str. F0263]